MNCTNSHIQTGLIVDVGLAMLRSVTVLGQRIANVGHAFMAVYPVLVPLFGGGGLTLKQVPHKLFTFGEDHFSGKQRNCCFGWLRNPRSHHELSYHG